MVTTLIGENRFAARQELDHLVADWRDQHGELGINRFDGDNVTLEQLQDATLGGSLFNPASLTIVNDTSANKTLQEDLLKLIPQVAADNHLIIFEPAIDKRTSYYKQLQKLTDVKDCKALDEHQLAGWLVDEAKTRGGQLDRRAAQLLVLRVGNDQWQLSNELDKLINYDPSVTPQTIELLVEASPNETIFNLLDAMVQGRVGDAMELYRSLRAQLLEPQYILGMIAWQLHSLALVKHAGERTPAEVAREAKISPYVVNKLRGPASKLSKADLRALFAATSAADLKSKSTAVDVDLLVEQLIAKLATRVTS